MCSNVCGVVVVWCGVLCVVRCVWSPRRVMEPPPGYGAPAGSWSPRMVMEPPPGNGAPAGLWSTGRVMEPPVGLWSPRRVGVSSEHLICGVNISYEIVHGIEFSEKRRN